ncbi:hypothetical protein CC86DRAFT_151398 [Ophiobolus disseminans]|uniref:Uncharacterized protein n=1 Tax=Ophiobolus disseminans TaxID=1469910 RepID=A0A6A6ZCJ4_9PLEO|nr:hypothetical protein CC86DRAFT_151398 [Ophiobolus disseminans]
MVTKLFQNCMNLRIRRLQLGDNNKAYRTQTRNLNGALARARKKRGAEHRRTQQTFSRTRLIVDLNTEEDAHPSPPHPHTHESPCPSCRRQLLHSPQPQAQTPILPTIRHIHHPAPTSIPRERIRYHSLADQYCQDQDTSTHTRAIAPSHESVRTCTRIPNSAIAFA